jgi:hypothetical protein
VRLADSNIYNIYIIYIYNMHIYIIYYIYMRPLPVLAMLASCKTKVTKLNFIYKALKYDQITHETFLLYYYSILFHTIDFHWACLFS